MKTYAARTLVLLLALLAFLPAGAALASDTDFDGLTSGQRVYDLTESSLTPEQTADVQRRLDALQATGADPVVVVRNLDVGSDETLEQVEQLQSSWARLRGTDRATAVAFLINRNPKKDDDARAGVFVGTTYDRGNVPEGEQRNIVSDALIPPLRDGDVHASLVAGIDRLTSSIQNGPPTNAFQRFADRAGGSWLPWVLAALVAAVGAFVVRDYRRRPTPHRPAQSPTSIRPSTLEPAVAGALARGGPDGSALQAVLLDLASRGALALESDPDDDKQAQLRLTDESVVRTDVEQVVWRQLQDKATRDVVTTSALAELDGSPSALHDAVEQQLRERGWFDPQARHNRRRLGLLAVGAILLAAVGLTFAAVSEHLWLLIGTVGAVVVFFTALTLALSYPRLSRAGLDAAQDWRAYRDGLGQVGPEVDLQPMLPDVVALGVKGEAAKRLEDLQLQTSSGATYLPYGVFTAAFVTTNSSGAGGAGVVSGGFSGGGGAAGST